MTEKPLEWFIVSERRNGGPFYPDTIPQKRSGWSKKLIYIVTVCLFIVSAFLNLDKNHEYDINGIIFALISELIVLISGIMLLFVKEILLRFTLLIEEYWDHFTSRYNKSYRNLFNHIFYSPLLILVFVFELFIMVIGMITSFEYSTDLNLRTIIPRCLMVLLIQEVINFKNGAIYNSLRIEEENGLNYGSAMAYSFYYGYLNLIMENTGNRHDKNLIEAVENYCATQGVEIPVSKLFILIPKSCECFVSLKNERFPDIEESASLEEKIKTVAGVQNRVYKNSVYKIFDRKKDERVYVCVEYATPIKTFHAAIKSIGPHIEYLQKHREDIVLQFYLTLSNLIHENVSIRDSCELIYYDDIDERGNFRDLAQIILKRVRKLERKMKKIN